MSYFVTFVTPRGDQTAIRATTVINLNETQSRVDGRYESTCWVNLTNGRGVLVRGSLEAVQQQLDSALTEIERATLRMQAGYIQR